MTPTSSQQPKAWLIFSWSGWVCTIALFMVAPLSVFVQVTAAVSLCLSAVLVYNAPRLGLYLLPLPLMIGPVASFSIADAGNATIGDLYSLILVCRVALLRRYWLRLAEYPFLLLGAALIFFSALFSSNLDASFVALLKIAQFALLTWVSAALLKRLEDLRMMFLCWVLITMLCSVLLLWYLFNGQPSFLLDWASGLDSEKYVDLERVDILFRPAFFYTNFFVPLGISLLYAFILIFSNAAVGKAWRFLLWLSIPINLLTLVLNNTRAMLFPVLILSGLALLWYFLRSLSRSPRNSLRLAFFVLVMVAGVASVSDSLVPAEQVVALRQRSQDSSPLYLRTSVWVASISTALDDPVRLLVAGWGPQITSRQGEAALQAFFGNSAGSGERAFDSALVALLIEYGVIFVSLVLGYLALWFYRNWRFWRKTHGIDSFALLLMGLSLVSCHVVQQFGIAPPALIALQLFAFLPPAKRPLVKAWLSQSIPGASAGGAAPDPVSTR